MSDDALAASLKDARERYRLEREKRIRPDGLGQFGELKAFRDLDRDPFADPDFARDAITEETQAVIVGGGFGGMLTAVALQDAGVSNYRLIEKGGDFGGTWYWNRYPGCMCDVESYIYMPLLEETGYMPTERYASAVEIFEHCQRIGSHFGLYEHALFQTEIESATWQEASNRWLVVTTRGDRIATRFLITAGGILHKAKLPGIQGIDTYDGEAFHTSRWNYDITGGSPTESMDRLGDKRVGIIGTGATAIQAVPQLAAAAKEVLVFQRTPASVGVRDNQTTDKEWFSSLQPGWQRERLLNFTEAVSGEKPDVDLVGDGWTKAMWDDCRFPLESGELDPELEKIDFEYMQHVRDRVDAVIDDPIVAEKLKPWWGKHCKRLTFHDHYLQVFNEPNVTLVDTDGRGVDEIDGNALLVGDERYEVDVLIFASGFEITTGYVKRLGFDPVGRNGLALSERWEKGIHSLHGILTAKFPNLLVQGYSQSGFGVNFVHFLSGVAEHLAWIVAECERRDIVSLEPTEQAEDDWLMTLFGHASYLAPYTAICTPSYYNSEGTQSEESIRNVTYPGNVVHYHAYLEAWREAGDFPGAVTS